MSSSDRARYFSRFPTEGLMILCRVQLQLVGKAHDNKANEQRGNDHGPRRPKKGRTNLWSGSERFACGFLIFGNRSQLFAVSHSVCHSRKKGKNRSRIPDSSLIGCTTS